ncbi:MAG: 5'/3'-nucleotidase SurE [Pseudomonadota bacterium]
MRILIVNDDGIHAPGLAVAEEIARDYAGPEGEIWVVAPESERSGASHAITYTQPLRYTELGPRRFAVDGFPADCAMLGLRRLLRETPPDLVLSGVNRGHNLAEDVFYSGTVGAAMDATLNGVRAVAMSQTYSRAADAPADMWESARAHGAAALKAVLAMEAPAGVFHNVNFPARHPDAVEGMTVCPHGTRAAATFEIETLTAPNGRDYQFLRHTTANRSAASGTDAALCAAGWITITPLRTDLSAHDLIEAGQASLDATRAADSRAQTG